MPGGVEGKALEGPSLGLLYADFDSAGYGHGHRWVAVHHGVLPEEDALPRCECARHDGWLGLWDMRVGLPGGGCFKDVLRLR